MTKAPRYFIQIPVSNAERTDINSTDKLVFGEIHTMLNGNKYFFMSSKELGKRIGVNSRTVIRSIAKLDKLNYVDVKFDPHDSKNHKRYVCNDRPTGGDKLSVRGTDKDVSTGHDNLSRGTDKDVSTGTAHNVTVVDKKNRLHKKSEKNIPQMLFKGKLIQIHKYIISKWTRDTNIRGSRVLNQLLNQFDYQSIKHAIDIAADSEIGIIGMPNYVRSILLDQSSKPKGQMKRHTVYGRPVIKQKLPDWAKKGHHDKLHPTSKKMQMKIKKQLKALNDRGNKHE